MWIGRARFLVSSRLLYTTSRADGTTQFKGYWSVFIQKERVLVSSRKSTLLVALLLLVVSVSACGVSSASGGSATPTATPIQATDTPTDAPTNTPDAIAVICAGTPGTHVDALPADEPVPAGAILSSQGFGGSGGGATAVTFEKVGVCVSDMTPDEIRAFYSAQMPAKGWTQTATVPSSGADFSAACHDGYCWKKSPGNNSTSAVALENVRAYGTTTAYTLESVSYSS